MAKESPQQSQRCSRCGKDVTNRSRGVDASGAFICPDCLGKARKQPAKGKAGEAAGTVGATGAVGASAGPSGTQKTGSVVVGGDDMMSKLVQESIDEGKKGCPNCRAPIKSTQMVCLKCGFHREKGASLHTTVKKSVGREDSGRKGLFGLFKGKK